MNGNAGNRFDFYDIEAYFGDFIDDYDIEGIIDESTYIDPQTGNRYWCDIDEIEFSKICQLHDMSDKRESEIANSMIYTTKTEDGIIVHNDDLGKAVWQLNQELKEMFPEGRVEVYAHDDWKTHEVELQVNWAALGAVSVDIARQQAAAIERACRWIEEANLDGAKTTWNYEYLSPELRALRESADR